MENEVSDNSASKTFFLQESVDRDFSEATKGTFKTLLLQNKLKQSELAKKLGINRSYINRVVLGKQIPPLDMRLKIADILKCDSALIWRFEK